MTTRGKSAATLATVQDAGNVIEGHRHYWPLTLRQIYYRLVAALIIKNAYSQYRRLSRVLKDGRIDGQIPEDSMEDRSRSFFELADYADQTQFIRTETRYFLSRYRRDLQQSQSRRIEVWIEKDALAALVQPVAAEYCAPVAVARGQVSHSYRVNLRNRITANIERGQGTTVLYFGDLDPSGWCIPRALERILKVEMGVPDDALQIVRCGLNPEQVQKYDLPNDPTAQKEKDPNRPAFRAIYHDLSVELDALPPAVLQAEVRDAIERHLDADSFDAEREQEVLEREELENRRERALLALDGLVGEASL